MKESGFMLNELKTRQGITHHKSRKKEKDIRVWVLTVLIMEMTLDCKKQRDEEKESMGNCETTNKQTKKQQQQQTNNSETEEQKKKTMSSVEEA